MWLSLGFVSLLLSVVGLPQASCRPQASCQPSLPLPVREVYKFPTFPTYLEGIYARANGDLLAVTAFPDAFVYYLTGVDTDSPTVTLLQHFTEINTLTSIIETSPDVFTILGGNTSAYATAVPGTFGVWELDLRSPHHPAQAREMVRLSSGGFMTSMDMISPTNVLVADASMGLVWQVDLQSKTYELALQDPLMDSPSWAPAPVGISNIKLHHGYLYWSNAFAATFSRIPVTVDGFAAPGARGELITTVRSIFLDKFAFGGGGGGTADTVWAMTNADSRVVAIRPDGEYLTVAGQSDQMTVAGGVTGVFGRVPGDTHTFYVATGGGFNFPINGSIVEPGKIVAIDTSGFC
ncbi:hypothetical protein ASPZODRAFT_147353 [Penicilliopsis zonata CBS 506.65]|uniref:SMP-30/Gluconolactonase/LRE-like region domain-containing protein n=1 Tax=Penicilliopsis zonata CBS 506.65 TaxID=1073090 RepID=A0A1L9S5C0_9EURO|nr:hypothetical protein ASPZODRAFT_147353 [Penicilliopsis zonata CBS 506.65]OJJ42366.1 hypothetical protein ASPZODRAFT_147353 [Penicilliopsis zonata CBS 506.65]